MGRKKRSLRDRTQRRRSGEMLKTFRSQKFESKRDKARRKGRLAAGENPQAEW